MRMHKLLVLLLVAGPALADGAQTSVATGGLPTGGITDLFVSQRDKVKFLDVTDTLTKLQ